MNEPMTSPAINESRLLDFIEQMAQIGSTPLGGCNRQTLTTEDRLGRELFISWCEKIGGVTHLDSMGNLFVTFTGENPSLKPILLGSHLDTQPTGGKYDGVYGVLAALEVMTSLYEQNIHLTHNVQIVVWCNEEGARFSPAMAGSGVFAGKLQQNDIYTRQDDQGTTYFQALQESGQLGDIPCQAFPFTAALELHIEQGPILEAKKKSIGVVTGVQGMNWFEVTLTGETTHAGPTPMSMRKDPVKLLYSLLEKVYSLAESYGENARLTVGKISTLPSSPNTVPERVVFTLDIRHPEQAVLDEMTNNILSTCNSSAKQIEVSIKELWRSPAIKFSEICIAAVRTATEDLRLETMDIVSGAGHDSVYLSGVGPTGMFFVPCTDGISHNEKEHVDTPFLTAGANVLLHTLLNLSN
jgi:beta-ureidopropionase / N-carbamoyl-L-amino-acid hydrolase